MGVCVPNFMIVSFFVRPGGMTQLTQMSRVCYQIAGLYRFSLRGSQKNKRKNIGMSPTSRAPDVDLNLETTLKPASQGHSI